MESLLCAFLLGKPSIYIHYLIHFVNCEWQDTLKKPLAQTLVIRLLFFKLIYAIYQVLKYLFFVICVI